jgi:hypothetical protein
MGSLRAFLALSATCFALLGACGTTSDAPPQSPGDLDCLAFPLTSFCCVDAGSPACPGDFAAAALCATWPQGFTVRSYATACHGFLAVAVANGQYTTVYAYDATSGTLSAIGDDAASDQPGSMALECGAGPQGFTMPSDCAATWLDKTQGVTCGTGTATPSSVCH